MFFFFVFFFFLDVLLLYYLIIQINSIDHLNITWMTKVKGKKSIKNLRCLHKNIKINQIK